MAIVRTLSTGNPDSACEVCEQTAKPGNQELIDPD